MKKSIFRQLPHDHFIINPVVTRTIGDGKDAVEIVVHLECEAYWDEDHVCVVHGQSHVTQDATLDNGFVVYRKGEFFQPQEWDQDALQDAAKALGDQRRESRGFGPLPSFLRETQPGHKCGCVFSSNRLQAA